MRLVVQRVTSARVRVEDEVVGEIDRGLMVLVGVTSTDTATQAEWLAKKTAQLRVFEDEEGKMNRSLLDVGGACLAVSQFTLYGNCTKGNRPGYDQAAPPDQAAPLIEHYVQALRGHGVRVETGRFRAEMLVELENDGPVTLLLEK